jgi:hypothetical protein
MPIKFEDEKEGKVLAIQVNGKLTAADYVYFGPGFERLVQLNGKVRVLFVRRTPFFRPLSAENKMDSCGPLSSLLSFVRCSLCALKPFGKERTSRAEHSPSSLSRLMGFQYLPPPVV